MWFGHGVVEIAADGAEVGEVERVEEGKTLGLRGLCVPWLEGR